MATMTTVTLTPVQTAQVNELIAEGRFTSPDEAVEQLLSQVLDDELVATYSPEVLAHLQKGMDEVQRGEFVSQEAVEAFFEDWRNESRR